MATMSNLLRAQRFRERIETYMQAAGVPIKVRPPRARISEAFGPDMELSESDVKGLTSWSIALHSDAAHNWSTEMERAERKAEQDGRPYAAVVGYRSGNRRVGEQYVMLSLATFAHILKLDAEGAER